MLKPKFKDPTLEESFSREGFVFIKNFLNTETVELVKQIFYNHCQYSKATQNMYFSNVIESFENMFEISDKVKELIGNKVKDTFEDYRTDIYTLISKNPVKEGYVHLHRDFSVTDESRFEYRNVWIPLVDVNENNGTIFVVPKTKIKEDINERWRIIDINIDPEKYKQYLKDILVLDLKAGDAVIYAEKTLHGSFNNNSSEPRPTIHFGLLCKDFQFFKAQKLETGGIKFQETDLKGLLNIE